MAIASQPGPDDLVVLQDLSKIYSIGLQRVAALEGLSLRITQGQYVAIMGPSGSGKSTLLNILGCLDRPSGGQYFLGGQDVSGMDDNRLSDVRNTRIGFIFQSFNLIRWLTVTANIEVPLFYQGVKRAQRHPRSRELAEMVGLGNRMNHRPWELSGGQQQRVAVARALANDPLILLADEPTGNLDSRTTEEILNLFDDLHRRGRTIIMVTHEDAVAQRAQRVIRLRDGRVETDCLQ
ncbi:MAG: ABC transporter ATP-binding protein [Planctomycetaceae bacterium]